MRDLFCPDRHERRPGLPFVLSMILHLAMIPLLVLIGQVAMTTAPRAALPHAWRVVPVYQASMLKRPHAAPRNTRPAEHRASTTTVPSPAPPVPVGNAAIGAFDLPAVSRSSEQPTARLLTGGFDMRAGQDPGRATGGTLGPINTFDSGTAAVAAPASAVHDEPAELLSIPTPVYTDDARRRRVSGKVVLKVRLCANGDVEVLDIIDRLDDDLDQAAVDAVKKLRCRPAKRANVPVNVVGRIVVTFTLT